MFSDGAGLLQEVGVEARPMRYVHRIPVERSAARGIATAVAIVNDEEQYVETGLIDSRGPEFGLRASLSSIRKGKDALSISRSCSRTCRRSLKGRFGLEVTGALQSR